MYKSYGTVGFDRKYFPTKKVTDSEISDDKKFGIERVTESETLHKNAYELVLNW